MEPLDGRVVFSWRKSGVASTTETLIVRKEGSTYVRSRIDGIVIFDGPGESFTDTSVENGKEYHYALYVRGPYGRFSPAGRFKAIPKAGETEAMRNAAPQPTSSAQAPQGPTDFPRDLFRTTTGEDVARLQQFLIDQEHYPEALVTGYFGPLTRQALVRFQKFYAITPAAGYFGPITRSYAEFLLNYR